MVTQFGSKEVASAIHTYLSSDEKPQVHVPSLLEAARIFVTEGQVAVELVEMDALKLATKQTWAAVAASADQAGTEDCVLHGTNFLV